jgi:hypothetical protein
MERGPEPDFKWLCTLGFLEACDDIHVAAFDVSLLLAALGGKATALVDRAVPQSC